MHNSSLRDCRCPQPIRRSGDTGARGREGHPASGLRSGLQPGDVLLSGQVLALAIDARGAVKGCKVVETSGSVAPNYGCSDAASERFTASAAQSRAGYLSVLVYGHSEHVV